MARKAALRKYRKKYGYRRFKSVSMNYFKVKMEYTDRIIFFQAIPGSAQGAVYGGPARFATRASMSGEEPFKVSLQYVLDQYMYTNPLAEIFAYYKLTGIRVEVVPESRNSALSTIEIINDEKYTVPYPMVFLSFRAGNNSWQTVAECRSNNQCIILNPNQKVSRYWRVYGTTASFIATGTAFTGAFSVRNEYPTADNDQAKTQRSLMVYGFQPSWQVKISAYYLYKYSRA